MLTSVRLCFFFFKQKTAYEMRISDWSSDVCSSDLGDQMRGCSLHEAGLAMEEAAKLHASHWGDASLENLGWISETKAAAPVTNGELMTALWAGRSGERRVGKGWVGTGRSRW